MTKRHSFLTRSLALLLALVMVLSNANLGLRAFAAEGETITAAELLAQCYVQYVGDDALMELLESGYLESDSYEYAALPEEGALEVDVDTDAKTIVAVSADENWVPFMADVTNSEGTVKDLKFDGNICEYEAEGVYAVKVYFVQTADISAEVQENLLNAGLKIQNGITNLDASADCTYDLAVIAEAVETLTSMVEQGAFAASADAIAELAEQVDANGGELTLAQMNAAYNGSEAQSYYLMQEGAAHLAEVEALLELLNVIAADEDLSYTFEDEALQQKWELFQASLEELTFALEDIVNADWSALTEVKLSTSVDYAALDELALNVQPVWHEALEYVFVNTVSSSWAAEGAPVETEPVETEGEETEPEEELDPNYKKTTLYTAAAEAYGNEVAQAILSSGAVKGDTAVKVRLPDASGLKLTANELTVKPVDAEYEGKSWGFYGLRVDAGHEVTSMSGTGATITPAPVSVDVHYRLTLADKAAAEEIMALAAELKAEADQQINALNRLINRIEDLEDLDRNMINIIASVVENSDFTPEDDDLYDAENIEMVEYFTEAVGNLKTNLELNANGSYGKNLVLVNLLHDYQEEGFAYYLANYKAFQDAVTKLGAGVDGLVADEAKKEALAMLLNELDYGHYVEYIADLGTTMKEVRGGLVDTNAAIDMSNEKKLAVLVNALQMSGSAEASNVDVVYLQAPDLNVVNDGYASIAIEVYVDGELQGSVSKPVLFGTELTDGIIAELVAGAEKIFNNTKLYTVSVENALKAGNVEKSLTAKYNYTAKDFTVTIVDENGETVDVQTINVNDRAVSLPKHASELYNYKYYMGETQLNIGTYLFAVEDLADCTIKRVETDEGKQEIVDKEEDLNKESINDYRFIMNEEETALESIEVDIVGTAAGLQEFATVLLTKFTAIDLNGEPLIADGKVSLQTIINALFADTGFDNERVIALGALKGEEVGTLLNSTATSVTLDDNTYTNVAFNLNMKGANAQIKKVANGLTAIKPYMTFQSAGEYMDLDLTLPQPVYEVYLTALLATSELNKVDMNAINNKIAFEFLYDYIDIIMNSDADATSFQNTIDMLVKEAHEVTDKNIPSINVEQYAPYYDLVKSYLDAEDPNDVVITPNEDECTITFTAKDGHVAKALEFLFDMAGAPEQLLGQVVEYKEGTLTTTVKGNLTNADVDYEAMLIDTAVRGIGKKAAAKKVYDFTTSLSDRAKTMGAGVVMLLDDVNGDVAFNGKTILDLNGKTINGSVSAKEKLIIVDTNVHAHGTITGAISGNVTILDGSYAQDVSAFLKDGYTQENGKVRNAVYTLEGGEIVVDTNFMFNENVDGYLPAVHYMAVDLAIDLALNCYSSAALTIDNNDIYSINIDDLVGILGSDAHSDKVAALVDDVLACFRFDGMDSTKGGIDNFINEVVEDLLNLEAIAASIRNGSAIGDYTFKTQAWGVTAGYVADGDYVTAGIEANPEITKEHTFALKFDILDNGEKTDLLLEYLDELARILVIKGESEPKDYTRLIIDIDQPVRDGKTLVVAGGAEGFLSLDFSHREEYYVPMLSIALSYADPEAFAGLVEEMKDILNRYNINDPHVFDEITYLDQCAINEELAEALEAAIDQVTARDFFEALKKLADKTYDAVDARYDLEAIAEKVEFKLNERFSDKRIAQMEKAYDIFVRGVNKVLAKIDSSTIVDLPLSTLKTEDGAYMIDGDIGTRGPKTADYRGYGVTATLKESYAGIKIKLFAEDCLWGDANHDGLVNAKDATLVLQYSVGAEINGYFCTKRTNVDAKYDVNAKDATLILQHSVGTIDKFPAEK